MLNITTRIRDQCVEILPHFRHYIFVVLIERRDTINIKLLMITIFSSVVSHKTLLLIKIIVRISLAHSVPRAPTDHFRIIWCIREPIRPQTGHPR